MKRKILVFAPLFALFIAGCMPRIPLPPTSGQSTSTSSTSGSGPTTTTTGPTTSPTTTTTSTSSTTPIDPSRFGTLDNPITMVQAHALIDEIIDYSAIDQGKSQTYKETPIFLRTNVKSNSAFNTDKEIQYLNLIDGTLEMTAMYALVDSSVTKDYSAKDSMANCEVIVKGYGALYNKSGTKTFELLKKDDDNKPTVMRVTEPEPTPEPEKLQKTLAEIVASTPTKSQAYISTATIKSWADNKGNPSDTKTKYGNLIFTDGTNDIFVYGASGVATDLAWNSTKGEYVMSNSQAFLTNDITKDLVPGDVVNFWGTYYLYNNTTLEMDAIITSKVEVEPTDIQIDLASTEVLVGGQLALKANVTPPEYKGELNWTITEGASYAHINDEQTALIADAAGTVTLKVEVVGYENVCDTATVTVTAPQKELISSIVADPASLEMTVGQDATLELTILPENYEEEVSWTITSGEDYVSLDANHTIHAEAKGSATLRIEGAESHNGCTVSITVANAPIPEPTVIDATLAEILAAPRAKNQLYRSTATIKSWATNKGAASDTKSQYGNLILTDGTNDVFVYGASGVATDLAWNSETGEYKMNNSKAFLTNEITKDLQPNDVVDFYGQIYEYSGATEMDIIITGTHTIDPEGIVVTPSANEVLVGGRVQLGYELSPAGATGKVNWTLGEGSESFAEIDGDELVGLAPGTATVIGTVEGFPNVTNSAEVVVKPVQKVLVESIVPTPTSLDLKVGDTSDPITIVVTPEQVEENIVWSIKSGADYITLDTEAHTVTAVAKGTAVVRIEGDESHNGCDITVTVANAPIPEPTIIDATLEEILAAPRGKNQLYRSTATIKSWATNKGAASDTKSQYGNLILTDGTNDIFVYGASGVATDLAWNSETGEYKMNNSKAFLTNEITAPLQLGDAVDFYGQIYQYNQTDEMDIIITGKHIIEPTSVTITPSANEVLVGGQITLNTTINPDGATGNVILSLGAGSDAFASLAGNTLTGVAEGTAVVNAVVEGYPNATGSVEITVKPVQKTLVESIVATPSSLELTVGDTSDEITIVVTPAQVDEDISWSIKSGDAYITLDEINHTVTAVAKGTAVVRIEGAESHNGCDVTITVSNAPIPEPTVIDATLAEILAAPRGKNQLYRSKATIKSWATNKGAASDTKTKYGNLILTDGTNDIFVYGASGVATDLAWNSETGEYKMSNSQAFLTNEITAPLKPGDVVNFYGQIYQYNQTDEMDIIITSKEVIAPTGVEFKESSYEVAVDGTKNLANEVVVSPEGAEYELSFEKVDGAETISVNAAGVVTVAGTATGSDTANIKVTIVGTELTATCAITVDAGPQPVQPTEATVDFGKDKVSIASANASFKDNQNNSWSAVSTFSKGAGYFTDDADDVHIGSKGSPLTSLVMTMSFADDQEVKSFSLKAKGNSQDSGTIVVTVDNTEILNSTINGNTETVYSATKSATGKTITVTITPNKNAIYLYNLDYSYLASSGGEQQPSALPVIPQGNSDTKVEGAGIWIYLDNTSLGITGANAADIIAATQATVTIEATDNTPEPQKTAFKAEPVITSMEFNDYGEGTVRLHIVLDVGYPNDWALKHNVTVTMEVGGQTYAATLTFIGGAYQAA